MKRKTAKTFEKAIAHYFDKDFKSAQNEFIKVLTVNVKDKAARYYVNMCAKQHQVTPGRFNTEFDDTV